MQLFNFLDKNLVDRLVSHYNGIGNYRTESMKKADPGIAVGLLDSHIRKTFPDVGKFVGGNFYKHKSPYNPHIDHQPQWGKSSCSFIFPLTMEGELAHLVIFDQQWNHKPITWTMSAPIRENIFSSSTNTQHIGPPGSYDILNHTHTDIDQNQWEKYLSNYPKEQYYGMSINTAYPFNVGSVIRFDNSHIHCTSTFNGEKLGLALRYTTEE